MATAQSKSKSQRSTIRQSPARAEYDVAILKQILDDTLVGTVAVSIDGEPIAIPMAVARIGDCLYLHGLRTSRLMKHLAAGHPLCISIHHEDGIVVAKSGMHCSLNYRSVVIHGAASVVPEDQKAELLYQVTEAIIPNSRQDFRPHLPKELKATMLLAVPFNEAACKVRAEGPNDDPADTDLSYWSGVIPIKRSFGEPQTAEDSGAGSIPNYAKHYARPNQ